MRKTTLLALLAGAAVSTAALAQDETSTTTTPPPAAPPPVAADPGAAPTPADPTTPDPTTVPGPEAPAPAAQPTAAEPATPPAATQGNVPQPLVAQPAPPTTGNTISVLHAEPEPAAPPPPPPPPPTDPVTIAILNAIQMVCMPAARGESVEDLSKPLGYKKDRRSGDFEYTVDKPYEIRIRPQGTNQNVCALEIDYGINQIEPIVVGVHNWAIARGYKLYRNDKFTTDMERHTRSWEKTEDGVTEALVLVGVKEADGSPVNRRYDRATVLYSVTPAPEQ